MDENIEIYILYFEQEYFKKDFMIKSSSPGVFFKNLFRKVSPNSQENKCDQVFF